ncbi:uncharacterized protein E5676_scaffold546G001910 [Cucumis melo var. makuwa]|uniref:CACTA en-spm transposon protein n=1 Tax=Cucumis melo var. makuwa TaxID=1194695 RepID=A0A5A7VFB0_CUCMM|nr:uncharacterized protein E6C27_scaffold37G00960 [Cucumis melo var. makuwa]TYJ96536.1 uncharacterized protein E5676_scaffold546G001910 [Cucumis melo var. makuwa]
MLEVQSQPILECTQSLIGDEIYETMLGRRLGYSKGRGWGPMPKARKTTSASSSTTSCLQSTVGDGYYRRIAYIKIVDVGDALLATRRRRWKKIIPNALLVTHRRRQESVSRRVSSNDRPDIPLCIENSVSDDFATFTDVFMC